MSNSYEITIAIEESKKEIVNDVMDRLLKELEAPKAVKLAEQSKTFNHFKQATA